MKISTLGDITIIENQISNAKLSAVKALHFICYGDEGEPHKVRRALRKFSGFGWDKNSDDHLTKVQDVYKQLRLPDLITVSNMLGLDYSGTDDEIIDRICSFLIKFEYGFEQNDESMLSPFGNLQAIDISLNNVWASSTESLKLHARRRSLNIV